MGFGVRRIGIVNIVCRNKRNSRLLMQSQHPLIHELLLRIAVILHFQKEILLSEDFLITHCGFLRLSIVILPKCPGNLSRKTGGKCN